MNRSTAEKWMSMALDGELSPRRQTKLDAYLAKHPELATLQAEWRSYPALLKAPVESGIDRPTPEVMWQDVRRAIRVQQADDLEIEAAYLPRMRWASAIAGLALLVAAVWYAANPGTSLTSGTIAHADRTEVEWVETDLPDAMSMVYEDEETGLTVIWVLTAENGDDDEHAG